MGERDKKSNYITSEKLSNHKWQLSRGIKKGTIIEQETKCQNVSINITY